MTVNRNRNIHGKKVVKVVFTGGPCAGKTTCLDRVKELMDKNYGDDWNRDIVECVCTFEHVFDKIAAAETKKHTLILCDRGALDPKVFTPSHMWPQILAEMQTSEEKLMQRYDMVLLLHTAPDVNYTCDNNRVRREDPQQARLIDQRYAGIWELHPRALEIESNRENGMDEKIEAVWNNVQSIIQE